MTDFEQGLAEIERTQAELRHCIDEAKRLADDSQSLLDRSAVELREGEAEAVAAARPLNRATN